jgi:N-acetylmuramoyl-L-alanine amidase
MPTKFTPLATFTPRDLTIMARTLYGEARGEPEVGKIAIAWVIRNRAEADLNDDGKPDWWGEGIAGVCLRPWQFSCWNSNDPNHKVIVDAGWGTPGFDVCLKVAAGVLGDLLADPTKRSTHYFNPSIVKTPAWARNRVHVAHIGAHLFFNDVS